MGSLARTAADIVGEELGFSLPREPDDVLVRRDRRRIEPVPKEVEGAVAAEGDARFPPHITPAPPQAHRSADRVLVKGPHPVGAGKEVAKGDHLRIDGGEAEELPPGMAVDASQILSVQARNCRSRRCGRRTAGTETTTITTKGSSWPIVSAWRTKSYSLLSTGCHPRWPDRLAPQPVCGAKRRQLD